MRAPYVRVHRDDLGEVLADQAEVVQSVWEQNGSPVVTASFDRLRWNRTLARRLFIRNKLTAFDFAELTAAEVGGRVDADELDDFLLENAARAADNINAATEEQLQEALAGDEPRDAMLRVFGILLGSRVASYAESTVTTSANFGMFKAADSAGVAHKVWQTNSRNPRSLHKTMSGKRAVLGESFSNGMQWPGDPAGGADNNSNCRCSVRFED